jgi:peptide/nickel transport system permease protein
VIAIPWLFLLLFLASITTLNVPLLILVIAITGWLGPARLIRAESLTLRTRDYVQAVRVMGGGASRIVVRHIVPNAIGTIIVSTTFHVGDAILTVATLTYLNLGPPPPAASWGSMLSNGIQFAFDGYWWMIVPPGIAIILIVLAFNFLGDWLRERFEGRVTF